MFIGWMFRNRWLALAFAAMISWEATMVAEKIAPPAEQADEIGGALNQAG